MICRYIFTVESEGQLPASRAYALYSCLLSKLPYDYAEQLHEQELTPVSQFLHYDRERGNSLWQFTLLNGEAMEVFCPLLDGLTSLELNTGRVELCLREKVVLTAEEFIAYARENPPRRWETLRFLTPTGFKQNGRYVLVPQERLIIQSLMNKWNTVFPEYPLDDEDALTLLLEGVHISDYSLRSTRFPLKDNKIPGFTGSITFEARLAAPIMEIWNLLLIFSSVSGVGIKTALGMGGVE